MHVTIAAIPHEKIAITIVVMVSVGKTAIINANLVDSVKISDDSLAKRSKNAIDVE